MQEGTQTIKLEPAERGRQLQSRLSNTLVAQTASAHASPSISYLKAQRDSSVSKLPSALGHNIPSISTVAHDNLHHQSSQGVSDHGASLISTQ